MIPSADRHVGQMLQSVRCRDDLQEIRSQYLKWMYRSQTAL